MDRATTLMFALALACSPVAIAADAPATAPAKMTDEQIIAQFRSDLQSKRADIMAKGLTLTTDQAAKFWPLYEQYQKEQNTNIETQLNSVKRYTERYGKLDDAQALAYVEELLAHDARMLELRRKWLAKFQTVVPAKVAARAIQLDRRVSQVAQVQLSSQLPLVK